jgi:hypothetical protein
MAIILDGTLGETFPSWTTAGRPASPAVGQMGYNTTIGQFDCYTSGGWVSLLNTTSTSNKPLITQMPAGSVLQAVTVSQSTQLSTSGTMNYSSSLPTISQGLQILSTSFTPISSSSNLIFYFNTYATSSNVSNAIFALFEDSTCISAIAPRYVTTGESQWANLIMLNKSNSSTSARTYSVRFGGQPGNVPTVAVNTYPQYTGAPQTSLIIFEVQS